MTLDKARVSKKGFWAKLKRPFFILAPMANVTDSPFRRVISQCGKPNVFFTEFISADGLASEKGRSRLMKDLEFTEVERPIVAQFFTSKPEHMYEAAKLARELGFDGIDINMGCPDRKVEKQGAGAKLILNPKLAKEIILATKEGADHLPVSVKTRIGFNSIDTEAWISEILEAEPALITVHGRTRRELSLVPTHWDEIGKAAKLCKEKGVLIVGNGDVMSYDEGIRKANEYGLDGIMVGRGIFHNPWFFSRDVNPDLLDPKKKMEVMVDHINLFKDFWGDNRNFDTLKRFFKIYIQGWAGAKELRTKLMETKSIQDVFKVI